MAGTHSSVGVNPSAIAAVSDWYRAVKACTARRPASPALLSSAVAGAARPAITTAGPTYVGRYLFSDGDLATTGLGRSSGRAAGRSVSQRPRPGSSRRGRVRRSLTPSLVYARRWVPSNGRTDRES